MGPREPEPLEPNGPADEDRGGRKGFLLRLPAPLMAELRVWAGQELRSLNGHIEFVLREAVRARKKDGGGTGNAAGG